MTGRVVQPSGISLRASIRPLESEVIASGNRLTGGLDLRLGRIVVVGTAAGTVDVVPIGFAVVGEVVVVVVGEVVAVAANAGANAIVVDVDVARLSSEEVAGAAPLGVFTTNDPAVPTVPAITANTSNRRRRLCWQAMAVPRSVLENPRTDSVRPRELIGRAVENLRSLAGCRLRIDGRDVHS